MLKTSFLGKTFPNPSVLASGILGVTGAGMNRVIEQGCGGITIKSVSLEPRTGHPNPTMIGKKHFFINAVGLSNPGVEEAIEEIKKFRTLSNAPVIGSVFAGTPEEFAEITRQICRAPLNFLEINVSCPNVSKEFGDPFAYSIPAVQTITQKVKENSNVPVIIKLTPQAWNVADIAKAAQDAGADAICAGNTISGMVIDVRSRQPILHNKQGGVSGPALFPVALKAVYDIYKTVDIPIIGTGGITTGEDALAMIMAGATLLGVGSAVYYEGEEVFKKITDEMIAIMHEENIHSLDEIRGAAHN
ncbi:dihydroorotate dehydrogenase [Candidatus Parcubacteria bacterium]|nr:MAG: dihydroorotate dehydrogenase [Candidatus Parcubacteria bacterium]